MEPVKGSSHTLKRGTLVKMIRLTGDTFEADCRISRMMLGTEFLKKV
ncbi:MAG: PhnA domain-containing protein [Bacteroidota bacterium]